MSFEVPEGWENFYYIVSQKYESLIDKKVINHIDKLRLNGWLHQFHTLEEKYLAAHLLDSFIYRTDKMNKSVYEHILYVKLPLLLENQGCFSYSSVNEFITTLTNSREPELKFATIEKRMGSSKSGGVYLREFRVQNSIQQFYFINSSQLHSTTSSCEAIVFIDDIVGTGKDFIAFYSEYELDKIIDKKLIYIPLIAHEDGVKKIKDECSNVNVSPVEILTKEHNFFSDNNGNGIWSKDKSNKSSDVIHFYQNFLRKKNIYNRNYYQGKGKLGLSIFFAESSPNNSLSIYYTDKNGWLSLVDR